MVSSRIPAETIAAVDGWAAKNGTTRSQAIARLVELGLTVKAKRKEGAAGRERARELASNAIDNLTAGAPESDEKASRKGRLIKGPEEFRGVRVDRPKPKKS